METSKAKTKKGLSLNTRNTLIGLSFILPNFIGFFIFILIPVAFSFVLSFAKWDGFNKMEFAGLKNFTKLFKDSTFSIVLGNTAIFTIFSVLITLVISLGLAMLLNKKLRGVNFFRSAIFFPYVASIVAIAAVWNNLFSRMGPINNVLAMFGITDMPGWTASTKWALPAVIIVNIWKNMGYFMILYLAALQDIPTSLYEASMIDGASGWQRFKRITFPMLTPTHFFVFMMLTINSFKIFDLIFTMTEGGPGDSTRMIANYIYDKFYIAMDYGATSAASMVLLVIVGTITVLQFRAEKKFNDFL
ncbi:MAG: sugar ABC transporter permease [Oscillospiraceae bacterium]